MESLFNYCKECMVTQFSKLLSKLTYRLSKAFLTKPNTKDWLLLICLGWWFSLIVLPLGFHSQFLAFGIAEISLTAALKVTFLLLIMPSVVEEIIFRVFMTYHKTEEALGNKAFVWWCISLISYIIYHPLNSVTFYPEGFPTFINPIFLISTTLLGIACTYLYWKTGSIYPSIIIHWITVVVWLLFLSGYDTLYS